MKKNKNENNMKKKKKMNIFSFPRKVFKNIYVFVHKSI